jgi:TolB-like protein/Flp pilus assembly protein TadD
VTDTPTARDGEGAWARLRRRKVAQWGLAYAAGAWGFLQGLQYVSDAFGWAAQLRQVSILALLVGLPIVLVIAWYHGDKGEQRVTRTELAIVTFLFLLGGALFWRYERASVAPRTTAAPAPTSPSSAPAAAAGRPSIAVLPFENRSSSKDDAYFVDGIHDDILTQLAKVSAMKVISRTSVERFRDTRLPIKEIALRLGVNKILEGGVQRAGDRVRITVQLIDASTDDHLWAETYDRELTAANIFAIQSEVASAIAAALNAALSPAEKSRASVVSTQSLPAWEAYQLGSQRLARRTSNGIAEAETFFQRAIALDAEFARPYAGLAVAHVLQSSRSSAPAGTSLEKADKAVATALRLDPNLAEAWAASGLVAETRGQSSAAEQMYRRAIALNPNYATAYQWLSSALTDQGRNEEARGALERALELDPLSAIINENLAEQLESLGRFADAEARYRKVIEIDPSMPYPYMQIGILEAYARNRFVDAAALVEKSIELDPDNPWIRLELMQLYLDLGDDDAADRVIAEARSRWPENEVVRTVTAIVAMLRGDRDAARKAAEGLLALDATNAYALAVMDVIDLQQGHLAAARARCASAAPELFVPGAPRVDGSNWPLAVEVATILQKTGESAQANALLDQVDALIRRMPRLGGGGFGIADVEVLALRGRKHEALSALRAAERAGWRGGLWPQRYFRDHDPALDSIRAEPEFKSVFADIAHDMAGQRAELAARPKGAPLDRGSPAT